MTSAGLPHSEIPGSTVVCTSPRLIAAYHVLHRFPEPRHPPCALSCLTSISGLPRLHGMNKTKKTCHQTAGMPFLFTSGASERPMRTPAKSAHEPHTDRSAATSRQQRKSLLFSASITLSKIHRRGPPILPRLARCLNCPTRPMRRRDPLAAHFRPGRLFKSLVAEALGRNPFETCRSVERTSGNGPAFSIDRYRHWWRIPGSNR